MKRQDYEKINNEMMRLMSDAAHDKEHIYRVLMAALDIADHEADDKDLDMDVLIAACLLHDIGRKEQFDNPSLCHAEVGAEKAYLWLKGEGYDEKFAAHVRDCISSHRYRGDNIPKTIEAKILFDADKVDVAGALGIARTLLYNGHEGEPIYSVDENGRPLDGSAKGEGASFMHEYRRKLIRVYDSFYTVRGSEIAKARRWAMVDFYEALLAEVQGVFDKGSSLLEKSLKDN